MSRFVIFHIVSHKHCSVFRPITYLLVSFHTEKQGFLFIAPVVSYNMIS